MGADEVLTAEHTDGVLSLRINRPEKHNALNLAVVRALTTQLEEASSDGRTRVVVLSSVGRHFSAGADLHEVREFVVRKEYEGFLIEFNRLIQLLTELPLPTIAGVRGVALAGGLELVLAADLAVATHGARFGDQHATYGFYGGGGAVQRLPRIVGEKRAKWLLFSGQWWPAQDALDAGLVNELVDDGDLEARCEEMSRLLAALSPRMLARTKKAIRNGEGLDLAAAMRMDNGVAITHMHGADAAEGLAAFTQKRTPAFRDLSPDDRFWT
jgi:enoyl-CoA hydratase/carnithine racemase